MSEYIGYKDPIGNGLFNMGLTDEEIVRCRDCDICGVDSIAGGLNFWCKYFECNVSADGFCAWGKKKRCDGSTSCS